MSETPPRCIAIEWRSGRLHRCIAPPHVDGRCRLHVGYRTPAKPAPIRPRGEAARQAEKRSWRRNDPPAHHFEPGPEGRSKSSDSTTAPVVGLVDGASLTLPKQTRKDK